MPAYLQLSALAASFGARTLFHGLDLVAGPGDVTALVGPNGCGKSTLLRIVVGEHAPDSGRVRLTPPDARVGYLPQVAPDACESILAYAARRTGVAAAQAEFNSATAALTLAQSGAGGRYAAALERWLAAGAADLEPRLGETLARVGLDAPLDRPVGELSGGQAARAALASILVSRFDIALLDEPTNNLDAEGLAALTAYVHEFPGPILIASHDRHFLDEVATSVLELDIHQQQVTHYAGGWSDYRDAKEQGRRQAEEAYDDYAEARDALIEQARRKTEWARQGRNKAARLEPGSQLEKKFREDRARRMDQRAARARDAADRLTEVEQPRKEWELRYRIAEAPPSAEIVLSLDHVTAAHEGFHVGPVTTHVERGARVALTGPNGSGKSTLLQTILGNHPPAGGRISWGTRVRLGTLDQARDVLAGDMPLLDAVADVLATTDRAGTRTLLAKFGLGADLVERPCRGLSLGERTRAALAVLQGRAVNTLVLDEPTNHLDIVAIEQLESALTAFGGTLLLVSHDRSLLDALSPSVLWTFTRTGDHARVTVGGT